MTELSHEADGAVRLRTELFSRQADKDGHAIVVLTAIDGGDGCTVEFEVHPVDGETARRGRYRFQTRVEATRFVDEAMLALQYLGCSIS